MTTQLRKPFAACLQQQLFNVAVQSCLRNVCNNYTKHGLCAGLVGRSFVGFESVGWFGYYGFPTSARPWQNQTLWNWSQKCNSNIQTNWYCGILYAIFGYQVRNPFHFLGDSHVRMQLSNQFR